MTTQAARDKLLENLSKLIYAAPDAAADAVDAAQRLIDAKRALADVELAALATAGDAIAGPNAEARELRRRAYLATHPDYMAATRAVIDAEHTAAATEATVASDKTELRILELMIRLIAPAQQ